MEACDPSEKGVSMKSKVYQEVVLAHESCDMIIRQNHEFSSNICAKTYFDIFSISSWI